MFPKSRVNADFSLIVKILNLRTQGDLIHSWELVVAHCEEALCSCNTNYKYYKTAKNENNNQNLAKGVLHRKSLSKSTIESAQASVDHVFSWIFNGVIWLRVPIWERDYPIVLLETLGACSLTIGLRQASEPANEEDGGVRDTEERNHPNYGLANMDAQIFLETAREIVHNAIVQRW